MSKYFINGYKFHTEEWSKGKKTNNSGVWVKGEGDIDYYGVLQEIIELDYVVGWPKKKLVIFRCKWYDPDSSGTKVHPQYKIIEINHTRQYRFYDPFIIAQNVKQVYYVPYPLCKNKSLWRVVIKTKPVGRVEVEDALDVAYQNDIPSVEAMVDDELAGELQHSEGIYEEFDATILQSDLNNYGEGTSRANEDESQTDEYKTSDEELLEENEISDEEEFDSDYESNEED
ncbi:uncharacterized protein LOC125866713 [Solanum stenotomum]|uniref:uncharacterized protein LOC125866713 n=1 Tax=Solanum stenotomum TaxID=172797 RepID=UPI0020CFFBA0|nr:uncharacterized protein LOC125866713 [Solanum stenotomum]